MDYQSSGRIHRPKGAKIKQALQIILVLGFGVWLVYQIHHCTGNKTHKHGAVSMGRKGTPSMLDERAVPQSGNVQFDGATKDKGSGRIHVKSEDSQSDGIGIRGVEINEKSRWDGSNKEANAEDDDHKLREMQENATETGADADVGLVDGVHSFHDENGVPPEEHEEIILEFGKQASTKDAAAAADAQNYSQSDDHVSGATSEGDRSVV